MQRIEETLKKNIIASIEAKKKFQLDFICLKFQIISYYIKILNEWRNKFKNFILLIYAKISSNACLILKSGN